MYVEGITDTSLTKHVWEFVKKKNIGHASYMPNFITGHLS